MTVPGCLYDTKSLTYPICNALTRNYQKDEHGNYSFNTLKFNLLDHIIAKDLIQEVKQTAFKPEFDISLTTLFCTDHVKLSTFLETLSKQ